MLKSRLTNWIFIQNNIKVTKRNGNGKMKIIKFWM